jgi:hypothetical protein
MLISKLISMCEEALELCGDVRVAVEYYDPADGEAGTYTQDYDITAEAGHEGLTIYLNTPMTSLLLSTDTGDEDGQA